MWKHTIGVLQQWFVRDISTLRLKLDFKVASLLAEIAEVARCRLLCWPHPFLITVVEIVQRDEDTRSGGGGPE